MMNQRLLRWATTTAAVSAAAVLGACGSSGDNDTSAPPPSTSGANQVPASALVDATTFTNYARSLPSSQTADPVDINNFGTAPIVDSTEGIAI